MSNYRKLIAAIVGLTLIILKRAYGFDLGPAADMIVELVMGVGTAIAVWFFPNTKPTA